MNEVTRVLWVKVRKRKSQGKWSPKQKNSLLEEVQWADPCLATSLDKPPVLWVRALHKKTDALGGQQAHSDGSFSFPLIWQTAGSWIPNVRLLVSDSAMLCHAWGADGRVSTMQFTSSQVTTPERPSQVLPREQTRGLCPSVEHTHAN